MNKIYLINLTPLSTFFFGSEKSMGKAGEYNYLVHSLKFPQQTTLLGLLRFELLRQNGLLADPSAGKQLPTVATKLIGDSGFPTGNYGVVKKLSPVFLNQRIISDMKTKYNNWIVPGFDSSFGFIFQTNGASQLHNGELPAMPLMNNYEPKNKYPPLLKCGDLKMKQDDIFIPQQQTGITKRGSDEAFYKQTFYRFPAGWSFAFYVELDMPEGTKFENNTTWAGGENSIFDMKVTELNKNLIEEPGLTFPQTLSFENCTKITLVSPSFITSEAYSHFDFAYSTTIPFRYLKSNVQHTLSYYSQNKDGTAGQINRSIMVELFDRGSVFYFSNPKKTLNFINALNSHEQFQQIGYNYFTAS
jgi:CRISPR-associated protein Cmr3